MYWKKSSASARVAVIQDINKTYLSSPALEQTDDDHLE